MATPLHALNMDIGSKSGQSSNMEETKLVAVTEAHDFIVRCLLAVGTPKPKADLVADVLVAADRRGHFSHGLIRLDMYINDLQRDQYNPHAEPKIIKETSATAFVDGQNGLGMVVGSFCMDLAIKKAKETGIAWVTCTGSNHYGIAGYYTLKAVEQGMIGMCFTNTSPQVVPTRAKQCTLGTNPIAFGAPGKEGDNFMLDMATSTVAFGKVEINSLTSETVPPGWILDSEGKISTDPNKLLKRQGGLLPLGGTEITSGYKGYGLGMMVETICGVLSGGPFAQHIRGYRTAGTLANLGQTFFALDPKCFAMGFEERMQTFMDEMRQLDPTDQASPVRIAGDLSRSNMEKVNKSGGIRYHNNHIASLNELAIRLKVEPLKTLEEIKK